MNVFLVALALSTFLCALTTGIVLTFAIIIMPGICKLNDHDFLQAFKAIDRIIQNNNPLFMLVWIGSCVALITAAILGTGHLEGWNRALFMLATILYFFGVQLPTFVVNIPLNNHVQKLELGTLTSNELREARTQFEVRWTRWNGIRTTLALVASLSLIILAIRLC